MLLDAQDHLAIEKLKSKFMAALGASDVPAIGSVHADDAVVMAPRRDIVKGPNVRRFWRNMSKRMKNVKFAPDELELIGAEVVREIGKMTFELGAQGAPATTANYFAIWRKQAGEWKMSALTWSRTGNGVETPAGQ